MKKIIIIAAALTAILSAALLLGSITGENNDIKSEINLLESEFGDKTFESFYSLPELRAFSIIQLDRTVENYGYSRIVPEAIVSELTPKERLALKKSVIEFIGTSKNHEAIIDKMKSWCACSNNFDALIYGNNIALREVLEVMQAQKNMEHLFTGMGKTGELIISDMNDIDLNIMYHQIINQIAAMDRPEQFMCYASVYGALAKNMASK